MAPKSTLSNSNVECYCLQMSQYMHLFAKNSECFYKSLAINDFLGICFIPKTQPFAKSSLRNSYSNQLLFAINGWLNNIVLGRHQVYRMVWIT